MTKPTNLSALSLAELTAVYNQHAAKPIKKFSCSREAAIAKIEAVMPKPGATKKLGIGQFIIEHLRAKMAPAEVLKHVQERFPSAKTSIKCVYWYNSKLNVGAF